ncbi:uncharacterized protein LOC110020181 [Phalaenopsis equestris]|uniref:uncharacterized protein LOC110020181 n=1 Tax=Phalaenopsis equestris TaxID=78828 RepID=UPI0009E204E9|nr:uncharacterized protein LOC110020181 [Phalaenopsis equestris]
MVRRLVRRLSPAAPADRLLRRHHSHSSTSSSDLPDLAEEDVWPTATATATSGDKNRWRRTGGLSRALDSGGAVVMSSPPVAVTFGSAHLGGGYAGEEEVEDEGEWIPPHVYLAREQRKTAMATSVFEGVGRTLKGRDLSRVRNAVWSQTGFFG